MSGTAAAGALATLRPRSIAIIGASDKSRWSSVAFENLQAGYSQTGYAGALHLVNQRGGVVHGQSAVASIAAIDGPCDLGLVIVPAQAVAQSVDELGAAGVRTAAVLTSGFAETGPAGRALQDEVAAAARRHGMRVLGPNCLGFINFVDGVHAWTTPVRAPSQRSGVAIVSQSGATAYFLAELAYQQDIGLSYVISTGNELDLDASAFIDDLIDDPHTRAIALFIETVREPARFLHAVQRAQAAGKPMVVLKVGASEVTAKAAAAHTGALVGDDRVFEGFCRQFGLIRARSVEELLATADIAARTGVLREGGLCIVSNSGGICEIAADTAIARGIEMPALAETVATQLRELMPGFGTPHNPLDLTGALEPAKCEDIVRALASDARTAAILCISYGVPTCAEEESERLAQLLHHWGRGLAAAPIPALMVNYTHGQINDHAKAILRETPVPYAAYGLDRAIAGLAGVFAWSAHQRAARAASATTAPATRTHSGARPRSEHAALEYLAEHGVPVVPMTMAADEQAAVAAAERLAGPVVLKIASPDIAHKSDIGGVALDLRDAAAVRAAHRRIIDAARTAAPSARIDGVLVAPMRERGIELLVGLARDPQWGLVLAVGLGGIWVEVLRDVALRVLPVDTREIRRMLGELRGKALLEGARGLPAADPDKVAEAIAGIARAALALGPDLEALDVNPLWVRGAQVEALDALVVWKDALQ